MFKKLRAILLFDTSSAGNLQKIRSQILEDNRIFAVIWSLAQFVYETYSFIMSFFNESYALCRNVYVTGIVISVAAFIIATTIARKKALTVYFSILLNDIALFGAGLGIAWILLQHGVSTIVIFAATLIAPIFFVSNTLFNIVMAILDIIASAILLRFGLPTEIYGWCVTNVILFSSMGVTLGHFINKARFERYVFAESAVQLAESNARLAELQTKFAYFDQMTGLRNRRAYSEKVDCYASNMPARCCVVMADINGLKKANDTQGHEAGDELIVGTAECLKSSFDNIDTIYRFGGDEYCVISNGTEEEVKSRLVRFEKASAEWRGKYISGISVSYGFASTEEFRDIDSILKAADQRMYEFKRNYYSSVGKDRRQK